MIYLFIYCNLWIANSSGTTYFVLLHYIPSLKRSQQRSVSKTQHVKQTVTKWNVSAYQQHNMCHMFTPSLCWVMLLQPLVNAWIHESKWRKLLEVSSCYSRVVSTVNQCAAQNGEWKINKDFIQSAGFFTRKKLLLICVFLCIQLRLILLWIDII